MLSKEELDRTAKYWDEHFVTININRADWLSHPLVQNQFNLIREGLSIEEWLVTRYLSKIKVHRAVGFGVGAAGFELTLVQANIVQEYHLYDVSEKALELAQESAARLGIENRVHFYCQDLNELDFPENYYDLVSFISSLHHVTQLEAVLEKLYKAIVPGGLLFANEYIGPNRFAAPENHLQYARRFFRILDKSFKKDFPELPLPTVEEVILADPTEAVHSEEIVANLQKFFDKVEITPLNGSICFNLWWGLNHDALFESRAGFDLVQTVLDLEAYLIKQGRLPTYFAHLVAFKDKIS
jgi:ubiquinone/menaquinone biosynthesis C-methylase UbiE